MTASYSIPVLVEHESFIPDAWKSLIPLIISQNFHGNLEANSNTSRTIKFVFLKKATKIDEIFTVDLTLCSKCQIIGEDFVKFCGLLRKHEL